jgi:short-subunit dehydrogenase
MDIQYALITGASQGLGKAFAFELAKRKINCILIDLPLKELGSLSHQIELKYGIQCKYYEADLTEKDSVLELTKWVNDNFNVYLLINNAGKGGTNHFTSVSSDYLNNMIQLNITATILMTHQLMNNLMKQKQSYVLNVSSMAAFSPMGYKTVYPASKAFVHSFTRGLYQELKDTNVFVSVVNPGPMKTNKEVTERINKQSLIAKLGLQTPEEVAEISIRQLMKKDTMVMLNKMNGFYWLLMKIVPIWIRLPLMTRMVKKELVSMS